MSPNPATNNVTFDGRKKNKSIKEVQIIDKLGNVKKIVKYSGDQKLINLNISGLPSDIYYIKIYDGQKWESKQLRVQ
ncbi:MAG: T9SS type A sorting domain-containing protein [Chitinophagaceae bacterium]